VTTRQKAEGGRRKERTSLAAGGKNRSFLLPPSSFLLATASLTAALGGCGSITSRPEAPPPTVSKAPSPGSPRPGGYYLDDGPGANPPADIDAIPDAVPRVEPLYRGTSQPYVVLGSSYRPMTASAPYKARGIATWYGRRYHGKPTASGEIYDMYSMTAAHTTLPIPSYARVTNLKTGKSVVVRINDRGPFVDGRLIDVSYTAAYKLGILGGATMVEVESILPVGSGPTVAATRSPSQSYGQQTGTVTATPLPEMEKQPARTAPAPEAEVPAITPASSAPISAVTAAPPQPPVTTEAGRVFLQLGAFGSQANADGFLARLKAQADWLPLQIIARDGLHRVQAGPYASPAEARQVADLVVQALGLKPIVQTR
jgi:peptidoglycan lytic transglycosylase